MIAAELIGKSYEEIEHRLSGMKRDRLVKVIQQLATLEPHFSPEQLAGFRGLTVKAILKRIHEHRLRAHIPSHNRYRIPRSAVEEWDASTRVPNGNGSHGSPDV